VHNSLKSRLDPATGETITEVAELSTTETNSAIKAAYAALPTLRSMTGRERSGLLRAWHKQIQDNAEDLATLITWENGKPLADAKGEVAYANSFFEWFAEEAPRANGQTILPSSPGRRVYTIKEPVGVCGLISRFMNLKYFNARC
jgi:succinate-semialdehyde dehydrogenase/glutarate-semialdehyde dehydrogenase